MDTVTLSLLVLVGLASAQYVKGEKCNSVIAALIGVLVPILVVLTGRL